MTAPLTTFPDARIETLAVLRALLPAHAPTATAGTKTPEQLGDRYPGAPYLMVSLDAASTTYPVVERATVRVAVWGESDASGLALAQLARGLLVSYRGGSGVRSFSTLVGPTPTDDPDSGSPLSYFTVEARLRPVPTPPGE